MMPNVDISPITGPTHITLFETSCILVDKTQLPSHIQIPSLGISSAFCVSYTPNYEIK